MTVWVDPETKLPLRIDTVTREDGVTTTEITSGIIFDRPLDPALFVLKPPEGYKVETFGVAELQPEPAATDKAKGKPAAEMVATPLVGLGRGEVRHEGRRRDPAGGEARQDRQPDQGLYAAGILLPRVQRPHDDPARRDHDHVLHREVLGLQGPRLRRSDGQGHQDGRQPRRHREGLRQAEFGAARRRSRTCSARRPTTPTRRQARWT